MLTVNNVTKKYGKLVANDNVSFGVVGGEVSLLLGPNGAGKSTLIKCISGLLKFTGSIGICGNENKSIQAKRDLGYIPEVAKSDDIRPFIRRMAGEFMGANINKGHTHRWLLNHTKNQFRKKSLKF